MNAVLLAWLIDTGIVAGRSWRREQRPPLPSELLAGFVVFGSLSALAQVPDARTTANVLAWGVVIATVTNLDTKTGALRNLRPAADAPPSGGQ